MQPSYPAILAAVLGVIVLAGVFYIYRHERRLESLSMSAPAAEKAESPRPWSRQFLIDEVDLENGPDVEGEDDRNSLCYEAPMAVGYSTLLSIPTLAFDDRQLVRRPEDQTLVPPPPRSNAANTFPSRPFAALLSDSHARRGSDMVTLTRPGVRGSTHPNELNGAETVRSSMASASASSILPPSYHSHYPGPRSPQSQPVAQSSQRPASWEDDEVRGEGAEEDGVTRPRRSFDGRVRLAGGCPGEQDSGASVADGVSGMPPTYHDL